MSLDADIPLLFSVPPALVERLRQVHRPWQCWFCAYEGFGSIVRGPRYDTRRCPAASSGVETALKLYVDGTWQL